MKSSRSSLQRKSSPYPMILPNSTTNGSQRGWKSTLVRTLERIPLSVSCARSPQDSTQQVQHTTARSPPPSTRISRASSPDPTRHSSQIPIHASLAEAFSSTYASLKSSVDSEITQLRAENFELSQTLAKLKYERDAALERLKMLGGKSLPADRVDGMLYHSSSASGSTSSEGYRRTDGGVRGKRKREVNEENGWVSKKRSFSPSLDNVFSLEYPPAEASRYLLSDQREDADTEKIEQRRMSTETVYSTSDTLVEGDDNHSPSHSRSPSSPIASLTSAAPAPTHGDEEKASVKQEPHSPSLPPLSSLSYLTTVLPTDPTIPLSAYGWCPSSSDDSDEDEEQEEEWVWSEGEGECDMELASQSSGWSPRHVD